MEEEIKRQEIELLKNKSNFEVYGEMGIGVNYKNLLNWHNQSIKNLAKVILEEVNNGKIEEVLGSLSTKKLKKVVEEDDDGRDTLDEIIEESGITLPDIKEEE